MHLQVNTLFDLWLWPLGGGGCQGLMNHCAVPSTFATAKFEVAISNSLVGDAFTRKYIIWTFDFGVKVTQIQGSQVRSRPCPIFSWRLIVKQFLRPFSSLLLIQEGLLKYVHEVLVNCLVKLAQEKSVVRWTDRPDMTIAVDWDVKN